MTLITFTLFHGILWIWRSIPPAWNIIPTTKTRNSNYPAQEKSNKKYRWALWSLVIAFFFSMSNHRSESSDLMKDNLTEMFNYFWLQRNTVAFVELELDGSYTQSPGVVERKMLGLGFSGKWGLVTEGQTKQLAGRGRMSSGKVEARIGGEEQAIIRQVMVIWRSWLWSKPEGIGGSGTQANQTVRAQSDWCGLGMSEGRRFKAWASGQVLTTGGR